VPYNVYQEEDDVELPPVSHIMGQHRPGASESDVSRTVELLAEAMRPVIFIGHGATLSEVGPEFARLQKTYGIPIITSPNGMGCVPADDALTLGFIGRNGAYPANQAGRHAEVAAWRAEWEAFVQLNFGLRTTPLRPEYVVDAMQKVLPDDAILNCNSGVHHNWFMQFWKPKCTQTVWNRASGRAGERSGALAGSPRWVRIFTISAGCSMAAIIFSSASHCG